MKILLRPFCVSSCSTLSIFLFASRVIADFTATKWNPVRGTKFTIAWSGTSDADFKNLTLNDADSSGNEFAVVENVASGINRGSFTWLPSTSIPDGTYVINLYETPNRVNKNGLTFIGKLFVFGDANANQRVGTYFGCGTVRSVSAASTSSESPSENPPASTVSSKLSALTTISYVISPKA
ncbi:hypothetical protein BPOR_0970g00030 [Botrytis porri]|uniref:Yeast cell wall synthesis Kre9/Knh1-like N-terminal domain-containing protein n=1 Tax=Botrytis porri TaxID=87229 RepID=A0A4Z1KL61_9HELO|nr:hypothetical protein BPOR_0970g00030 [Botrytis porri]